MPDFWRSCGYRLLTVKSDGQLAVTDAFLRSYLLQPELAPVADSCAAEIALHSGLLAHPRDIVSASAISAIADADAQDNYRIWLRFRDRLLSHDSVEAAYRALFDGVGVDVPPQFVAQLTQILVRHLLGDAADPLAARAGEMLFRAQSIALSEDGAVMAADTETVERYASADYAGDLAELLQRERAPQRLLDLDVLDRDNATRYWDRDERFDVAISLNRGQPAQDALCRLMERWIEHFLGVQVRIQTERAIDDRHWMWHIGLDGEASGLLNDLYNGVSVSPERLTRLLCLFRLDFADAAQMRPQLAGRPVYLAMAMDEARRLKLKPQNLLLNLPLAPVQ